MTVVSRVRQVVARVVAAVALGVTGAVLLAGTAATAGAAAPDPLPAPEPLPSLPAIEDPDAVSTRLVPVPAGCAAPDPEQAVFVGFLVQKDSASARFAIGDVRSGSLDGWTKAGFVDVRYGDEVRFLDLATVYLVGTGVDPRSGVLVSTVRPPAPLFGGSDIAGLDDTEVDCPVVDDPVRTLLLDGTSVDSSVLSSLDGSGRKVLRAVLQPVGVALAVLVGLVALKLLVFSVGRSVRHLGARSTAKKRVNLEGRLSPQSLLQRAAAGRSPRAPDPQGP